jgi:ABC-type multidrug transport system fused ATPase/permease subunit
MNPLTYILVNGALIVLLWSGAWQVQGGILTQGAVVALVNYLSQILVELIKLANLIINITKSVACGKRIQAVLDLPAGEPVQAEAPAGDARFRVQFCHAGLKYAGAAGESLSDVSLSVLPGETVGVIGGTSSGKSTLVHLIPRFYEATEGRVLVDGKDVRSLDPSALRGRIGLVPQKAVLFHGTIRDNLRWGRENASDEELLAAAEAAQAMDVLAAKGGLDGMIEQGGRNLSGGQRQRLTIARALVRQPDILILDDSSSALDFATDAALRRSLRELPSRPAVFIVSQRTSSIRHADQIIVLDDGHVAGIGRHDDLLKTCPVYQEIYDSQFRKEAVTA